MGGAPTGSCPCVTRRGGGTADVTVTSLTAQPLIFFQNGARHQANTSEADPEFSGRSRPT